MIRRKTKIIITNGDISSAVDQLGEVLKSARAPIYIHNNQLVWRFINDGSILPLNGARLIFELGRYVTFIKAGKPINPPVAVIAMFLSVAATYRWLDDLEKEE
jgi:hypothetical protein